MQNIENEFMLLDLDFHPAWNITVDESDSLCSVHFIY